MKRLIIIFMLLLAVPMTAEAGKKPAPPTGPTAAEQQAFTDRYWQSRDAGGKVYDQFAQDVTLKGTEQERRMFVNLFQGKAADGSEAKGFHGDPNDPGPQDWSDWNIETDADGNVTGFKEKDFEQKDKDGDGEISDAERAEWDKKKKEEDDARGGPVGDVDRPPDWDKDRDGKPDPGFALDCYQCKMPPLIEPQCQDGAPGPCDSHSCDEEKEECVEHTEKYGARELVCHNCVPKEEITPFCEACGFTSDSTCGGECNQGPCVPVDVNVESCKVIPTMQTRERGSTQKCYTCMKITEIEITWVVIIIETPFERFVLGKEAAGHFKPSSVMALAKVDQASGMIPNTLGQMKQASDFLGSFNVGMGLPGLASPGKISMDQMTGLLGSGLNSGGSYGANCFEEAARAADTNAAGSAGAAEAGGAKKGKSLKAKKEKEALSGEQMKAADSVGNPAVSGPIVACGEEDGNKVLKIYSAGGALVDTITRQALKLNPGIILEKMGIAQEWSDMFIQRSGIDFAGYIEKFTGLPIKQIQSTAAQVAQIKGQADQLIDKKKKKKVKVEGPPPILPNDPLFDEGPARKQRKLLGILGSSKAPPANPMGSLIKMGIERRAEIQENALDVKDQWGIQKVGFTPWDDPNSAWNVVDANEKNIVVAVVDSGLDMTHPDGPQYIWTNPKEVPGNGIDDDKDGFVDDINGWNFLDDNHDFTDVRGHGTFVAGIIAAKYNNGIGIAGINPGAVIMPVKVADEEGETNSLLIYRGINYAVDHGAKVINVSLGGRTISKLEQQAVERAHAFGALVVIAAGNGNDNIVSFGPSSSKHGLAVGQIDYSGTRSTVSNWGPNLGLVAPGEQIYSLCSKDNKHVLPSIRQSGYYKQDGTSFSTPMVAATASLIWAKNPNLTNQQVADIILATATDMGDPGWDGMAGAGLLNASAALRSDATAQLTVMFTNLRVNRDVRDQVVSVDVYGTVRGRFKEYTVEAGKGKNASRFTVVAGPYHEASDYGHISRLIVKDVLRGADDWILRIRVIDPNGQEHIASTPFTLPK
ncbi:MAG: S8 family serine peptidase [Candidatus Omnitrophica bacterium]|nr:S8 family serine peptidase [Candidatus Omnitrophota bacterium]